MIKIKNVLNFLIKIKSLLIPFCLEAIKYYILYPVAMFKYSGRNIYLVAERGKDARDNGYHLYKYIRTQYPDIEAYYVITRESADYEKISKYGNIVDFGSLQHYLLFIAAKVRISSHIMGFSPNCHFYTNFTKKMRISGRNIFLQHGVIKDSLPQLYQENTQLDLFICGAKPEFDYILSEFHYTNNQVQYTGLARYDNLHNIETKNQILIMPTWRLFLAGKTEYELANSEYIKKWNSLLKNERLNKCLEEFDLELIFYPHYEVQKYIELFQKNGNRVHIADFDHYDVQQLLKESKLLVTDYSSVFFDFAYMRKPCVYYQFDKETFFSNHYARGYFNYENMGFGELAEEEDNCVELIIQYIINSFRVSEDYLVRMVEFFPLYDSDNCERIFNEILNLRTRSNL